MAIVELMHPLSGRIFEVEQGSQAHRLRSGGILVDVTHYGAAEREQIVRTFNARDFPAPEPVEEPEPDRNE